MFIPVHAKNPHDGTWYEYWVNSDIILGFQKCDKGCRLHLMGEDTMEISETWAYLYEYGKRVANGTVI